MSGGSDIAGLWMNTEQVGGLDSKIWEGLELLVILSVRKIDL